MQLTVLLPQPVEVFSAGLVKAKQAIDKILDIMDKAIPKSKEEVSIHAPKVASVQIPPEKIGDLIGPGGKNIRMLSETTGTEIEVDNDGKVNIFAVEKKSLEEAERIISTYALVPEVGQIYEGIVDGVVEFGAFVEIGPSISGLVHVSEINDEFVKDVNQFVKVGDKVKVKILDIDSKNGKMKLSMKGL